MKIRNGFVSNSSSSSFILAIHGDSESCPHCHRKDPDLQDLIEARGTYNDDTKMVHCSKESVLEDLDERIKDVQDRISDAKLMRANDLIHPNSQWTWGERIKESLSPLLKELQSIKKKVEKENGKIFECKVSYHDEFIRETIRTMTKGGRLTIIFQEKE